MPENSLMIMASFVFFLLVFVAIGALAVRKRRHNSYDYLLASRDTKPWLTALSAVATNNSGYMFVGQIGFTYLYGLHSIWLMIGWIAGDFLTSLFVHKKLRARSEKHGALSFASALSHWQGGDYTYLKIVGGLLTIAFLGTYAAAQLNAGSKALSVLFGWDYALGAVIGAFIVLLYCFAGGIRASIWTDAAQSFVMFAAMVLMVVIALITLGGVGPFIEGLHAISPDYMSLFPADSRAGPVAGPVLFVLGWFFAGMGVIGQPHVMVRFMAMDEAGNIARVRAYYYAFYISFFALTITAAFAARLLLPETDAFDAELALPSLALHLLPDILVGLVLAGLFAATMSTADSQILCCTAALTHDLAPRGRAGGYLMNKLATLLVTLVALGIALYGSQNVFTLVIVAWSALGSAFAPLLIVYCLRRPVSERLALTMMAGGLGTMLAWRSAGLNDLCYEIAPGILAGLAIFALGKAGAALIPRS